MAKYGLVISIVILCGLPLNRAINETDTNIVNDHKNVTQERTGRNLHKDCDSNLSVKCLKIHVISFLEDINSYNELNLFSGLSIVKDNQTNTTSPEEMAAELARQFPGKSDEKLNRYLLYRLQNYLDGHSLRYRLLDPDTSKDALNMAKGDKAFVGRGKGGGGGGGGGLGGGKGGGNALLAAALMMKGTLAAAALGALALLAGKALMTALMSLLLSALVGLKGGGGHKSTTYEIITKPEVSHHHSNSHEEHHEHEHHHGGYRRAYDTDYNHYNSYMPYDTAS